LENHLAFDYTCLIVVGGRVAVVAYGADLHTEPVVQGIHLVVPLALEENRVGCLLAVEILVDHHLVAESPEGLMVVVEILQARWTVVGNLEDCSLEAGNQIDQIVVVQNQADWLVVVETLVGL
jgi:hypothetical protein